jgi:hypothetical protein
MKALLADTSIVSLKILSQVFDTLPNISFLDEKVVRKTELMAHQHSDLICSNPSLLRESSIDKVLERDPDHAKAAKNDDAPVPEYLWDDVVVPDGDLSKLKALPILHEFALRWWWRHTTKDFLRWFKCHHASSMKNAEYHRKKEAGSDCIHRCWNSSWWEWSSGSRPLFWRWPQDYRTIIRDGLPPWIKRAMPRYLVPQRGEKDDALWALITSKLKKVRDKGYIAPSTVHSLTSFFMVPKGTEM